MTDSFDLYDREKNLLSEGAKLLKGGAPGEIMDFSKRLCDALARIVRENEDLTRHSDRQERRLVKLNRNLKKQTFELDEKKNALENLSSQLAKYIPPQIHDAILEGKYDTQVTTTRKKLTVFFSDIKNFTQISENLQPEALTDYLNEYFSEMTNIAISMGATIDKYIGDAMMVFFGDPKTQGVRNDARSCVEMALKMQDKMKILQSKWKEKGFDDPFQIRMGINTGYCNVGNFGSDQRITYTIIGGEVNVAQRLEANSDINGILMSYETYIHAKDLIDVEERQAVKMKGINRDIKTYSVIGRKVELDKNLKLKHPDGTIISFETNKYKEADKIKLIANLKEIIRKMED